MCWIASFFLLQRLKETFQWTCANSKTWRRRLSSGFFSFRARRWRKFTPFWQKPEENMHHRMPPSQSGWSSLNLVIIPRVLHLDLDHPNCVHPGRYSSHWRANLEDRRIWAKSIAEQVNISRERVVSIIHEDLARRTLSAKWVPKRLSADQKPQRCQST